MDGHFVPPITVGPIVVAALREQVHRPAAMLEVHLMIERPERHIGEFVRAGADSITFHAEATPTSAYAAGDGARGRSLRRAWRSTRRPRSGALGRA